MEQNRKHDRESLFLFGFFHPWALGQIDVYTADYTAKKVTVSTGRPFRPIKYSAAVFSTIHAEQSKSLLLSDIINMLPGGPVSLRVLRVWRTQPQFKDTVENFKWEYARYVAHGLLFGSDWLQPWFSPEASLRRLRGKIFLIREALSYDPDTIDRISRWFSYFRVKSLVEHPDLPHTTLSELAYDIWCVALLTLVKEKTITTRKKRAVKELLPKIIPPFPGTVTSEKWDWLPPADYPKDFDSVAPAYREDIGRIVKHEKIQPEGGKGLTMEDKHTAINFLVGRYHFHPRELEVDENWKIDEPSYKAIKRRITQIKLTKELAQKEGKD